MQPTHQDPLYRAAAQRPSGGTQRQLGDEIRRIARMRLHCKTITSAAFHKTGRNRFTRTIDAVLEFLRKFLPPAHWLVTWLLAVTLYAYIRIVRATAKIVTTGTSQWPNVPNGSVLVIWHGCGPSLLVAFSANKPAMPVKLMVSRESRGDCVALICRWLGFEIVRGDAQHGGWKAVSEIANQLHEGATALISPDGGGPPLVASIGAVALGSAAGVPLVPVGTDCRPAVFEPHKWDEPRNPLPFGRIAVACGEPLTFPRFEDAASLESARQRLQEALNHVTSQAQSALNRNS